MAEEARVGVPKYVTKLIGKWTVRLFSGLISWLAFDWVRKVLTTYKTGIFLWGFKALVKSSPDRAREIAREVTKEFFTMDSVWAEFVAGYMATMSRVGLDPSRLTGKSLADISKTVSQEQIGRILKTMLGLVMPTPDEIDRDPVAGAEKYLGVNMQFQMDAWMLHMLGDMQSFGIFKSLKDLPNAISWSFGLGWLSWLVMGVPFRIAIADPMERHFQRIYKRTPLTISQAIEAWQKGYMSAHELVEELRFNGYSDRNIDTLVNISKKEVSESVLTKLYQEHLITDEELQREIKGKGYTDTFTALISELHKKDREIDQRNKLVSQLEDLYVRGVVDEAVMRDAYRRANWNDRETDIAIERLNAEKVKRSQLSDSDIANAVEKDLLAWAEGRDMLMERGWSRREAEIFMKLRIPEKKWVS